MSNFNTFTTLVGGLPGTAPNIFSASTSDALTTVTAAGYVTDRFLRGEVKQDDIVHVNYLDASSTTVKYQRFKVNVTGSAPNQVASLVAFTDAHAAVASIAGGSASATITDPLITVNSIVVGNLATSTASVSVQKLTPGAGIITVNMSGDPASGSSVAYIAYPSAQ